MKVSEQLGQMLFDLGIRRIYGLPGEDHMALLDALERAGLDYCAAFDEASAVVMAATEAQLSGLPGVAVLSLAPGVSNGINGLVNTYLEQVPLILISGQHPADALPFTVRQGFDIESLVAPATKWRVRMTAGMNPASVVGKAVQEATVGHPGPVYLEIPDAVASAESVASPEFADSVLRQLAEGVLLVDHGTPARGLSAGLPDAIRDRILAARRPVLVLGGRRHRIDRQTVDEFARALRVPVFTITRQKGLIDSQSPYYAGTFLNGSLEKALLGRSDLVLMIDPEAFDFYNKPWNFDADAIAFTGALFTEWLNPLAARLTADPATALSELVSAVDSGSSEWSPDDVAEYRGSLRDTLVPPASAFSVAHAVDAALSAWPDEGYLVADAGFSKPLIALLSEPTLPGHFLASNALSTMGYAIPAAIGARRAGARPVLAFLGDGSLLMRATELMVSAGDGAPAVFVVLMDRALTQIEVKQERRGLSRVGVTLPPVSCGKLADAFGIDGLDVYSADELRTAVAKGVLGNRPMLIGAHVDPAPSRQLFELLRG